MKSKLFKERGQALIIIALAAIGLFGITGLAIDGSAKFSDRRHAQNAADSAALAAALVKVNGLTAGQADSVCSTASGWTNSTFCLDIIDAAWDRAEENGYAGLIPDSVDVYSPPISGPYANNSSYLQVIITSFVDTSFSRVVGINETRNTVEAVANVREGGELGDGAMLISYDPDPNCSSGSGSGGGSVDVSGSGTLTLNGGGIFLNSDEVCGYVSPNCPTINISSGSGISSAAPIDNINQSCGSIPEFIGQDPVVIPDDVYFPDVPPECSMSSAPAPLLLGVASDGKQEWLIFPGFYTDFPQAGLIPNNKHIYMSSGVYCINPPQDQDLSWNGASFMSLNGSTEPSKNDYHTYNPDGVTLYIKSGGGFNLNVNSPIYLDASTSGDLQGYLLILEGTHTSIESCGIEGGAYLEINGMVFAPYCDITVNGGSQPTAEINAQLLGWDLKINGNNAINFNYDPDNAVQIKRRIGLMR